MDEKVIKRLNVAFIVVIAISIIIPLISTSLFSLLTSEGFPQRYWDLKLYGDTVLSLILFIAGLIAYIIGCANFVSAKGYSRILGLVGLLPVFGIFILIFSKDKNKNEAISFGARFRKIYLAAILATFLPIVMLFATPYFTFQLPNEKNNTKQIIMDSGFSNDEAEAIIKEMKTQKGIIRSDIMSIEKINENEAEIMTGHTCGPLCGSGATYPAKKIEGKWIIEDGGFWVS